MTVLHTDVYASDFHYLNRGRGLSLKGVIPPYFCFYLFQEAIVANYPKHYLITKKKFNLDKKVPRLGIMDFVSLSPEALTACLSVTIACKIRRSQHKEFVRLSKEYNFKLHINPEFGGIKKKVDKEVSVPAADLGWWSESRAAAEVVRPLGGIDTSPSVILREITVGNGPKDKPLPRKEYVVKVVGKPKPNPTPESDDQDNVMIITPMGIMPMSIFKGNRRISSTTVQHGDLSKHYFTVTSDSDQTPEVQTAYYDRLAVANAIDSKLPYWVSVRERNALKYRICREMDEEEVISLAVNKLAQDELVKGYTVKK